MVTRRDMRGELRPGETRRRMAAPQARAGTLACAPPGCPAGLAAGRRTADLPPLALPACLSTLETKPWPRFFGALGADAEIVIVGGCSCAVSLEARRVRRAKHADGRQSGAAPRTHAARRRSRLRAAPPPRADWLSTRPGAASFCLAFRLCPSLSLRASASRRRCAARSQPAGERSHGHRPGAFEARAPAHVKAAPDVARSAARMRSHCTRDDTAATSGTTRLMAR